MKGAGAAFQDARSSFRHFAALTEQESIDVAHGIWRTINGLNLRENILPTRERAHLVLEKARDHTVQDVRLPTARVRAGPSASARCPISCTCCT
jgi:type I pantothenate kinase